MLEVSPCSREELVRRLRKLGFDGPYSGGKHSYMKRRRYRQTIPNPHGKNISSHFMGKMGTQLTI